MNRYRVVPPLVVHTTKGAYAQGEEFDGDEVGPGFDEDANLASGLLEIVPRSYKVVGGSVVDGHEPGETFTAAIPLSREALLLGSHLEHATEPDPADEPDPDTSEPQE